MVPSSAAQVTITRLWLRRIGIASIALAAIGILAIDSSYGYFKDRAIAEAQRRGLPAYTANSIKHAFAAAETYSWLRLVGFSPGRASALVYRLGQINEYAEFYGRPPRKRDPTREIYKDLWNNAAGVFAAAAVEDSSTSGSISRLSLIGRMTAEGRVLHAFTDNRVPDFPSGMHPEAPDLGAALRAFRSGRRIALSDMVPTPS